MSTLSTFLIGVNRDEIDKCSRAKDLGIVALSRVTREEMHKFFALDPELGKCYKSISTDGSCVRLIKSGVTKRECCVKYSRSFSVAFSKNGKCEPCPSKEGNDICLLLH